MALLLTSVIGNAIGLPYLQDDRTRNRNQQSDISRQKKQGTQNRQNTQKVFYYQISVFSSSDYDFFIGVFGHADFADDADFLSHKDLC